MQGAARRMRGRQRGGFSLPAADSEGLQGWAGLWERPRDVLTPAERQLTAATYRGLMGSQNNPPFYR